MFLISDPRKHPLRSFLLTVAIASSISLFLTLSSLSVGIRESSREAVENVGADIYVVPESLNPILVDLQSFDQGWAIIKELFSASSVPVSHSPRLKDTIFYFGNEGEKDETLVYGVVPGNEQEFDQFKIVKGSWFGTSADPLRDEYLSTGKINGSRITREVLVSEEFHRRSGLGPGDVIFLSTRMETEEPYSYVIQGVFLEGISRRSGSIMIHLGELQYMKGMLRKDTMTEILLAYDEGVDLDDIITWSEGDGFLFKDNVDLYKTEDILSEIFKFIGIIDGFSAIVITVTMIVCLIFTSTLFMISTKQRSLDLAILRAIGFHPFKIVLIVIRESILMYLVGSIIGIIMGLGLNSILNSSIDGSLGGMSSGLQLFKVDERLIAITLFSAFILSLLSALVPAVISAKRSPVRAIRGEL